MILTQPNRFSVWIATLRTSTSAEHAGGMYGVMKDTVTCLVCHDASGADVGPHPDEDNDLWVTTLTEAGRAGLTTTAIVSHSIVYEVSCDRCHYAKMSGSSALEMLMAQFRIQTLKPQLVLPADNWNWLNPTQLSL